MSGSFSLLFQDVTELLVPAANPWGSSPSVLEAKELAAGRYEFTMQSGDIISVVAPNYSFKPTAGI